MLAYLNWNFVLRFLGLIWFIVPVSMIVCNDVMAYVFGFFFGKTPLIKLSPKKTWEGFIGGGFSTVIFGLGVRIVSIFFSLFSIMFDDFFCLFTDFIFHVAIPLLRMSHWIFGNFGENDHGLSTILSLPTSRICSSRVCRKNFEYCQFFHKLINVSLYSYVKNVYLFYSLASGNLLLCIRLWCTLYPSVFSVAWLVRLVDSLLLVSNVLLKLR